jgi:hypothetical protein
MPCLLQYLVWLSDFVTRFFLGSALEVGLLLPCVAGYHQPNFAPSLPVNLTLVYPTSGNIKIDAERAPLLLVRLLHVGFSCSGPGLIDAFVCACEPTPRQLDVGGQLINAMATCDAPYGAGVMGDRTPGWYNPTARVYSVQLCLFGSFSLYYLVPPAVTVSGPAVVQLTDPGVSIIVTGAVSGSPNDTRSMTYLWTVESPNGPVQLCPEVQMTDLELQVCSLVNGTYLFTLTVTDSYGGVGSASLRVVANAQPTAALALDTTLSPRILLLCDASTDSEDALADLVFALRYFSGPDPSVIPAPEEFVPMGTGNTPRVPEPDAFRPGLFSVTLPTLGTHWFQITVRDSAGGLSTAVAYTTNTVAVFAGHDVVVNDNSQPILLNATAYSSGPALSIDALLGR